MSWNGVGVFNRIYSWAADKAAAIDITASRFDTQENDFTANGFANCLTRDGQGSATANLPMNTFRHTGAGAGVATTDYATMGQLQAGSIVWAIATGTANAIAASYAPAIASLVDGQLCFVRAASANTTTTPTFAPSGLTPEVITKLGGVALAIGDISGAGHELILRYKLASTRWELLNPATVAGTIFWCGAAGGSGNAITVTDANFDSQDGYQLSFRATASNSGATTIAVSGGGAITVVRDTTSGPIACTGSEIESGNLLTLIYDANGSEFHISAPLTLISSAQLLASASGFNAPLNLGLFSDNTTAGSNLLYVALKGANGSNPSATNPVLVPFRSATATTGTPIILSITSALSIDTHATGATLGVPANSAFRFWVGLFYNAGTPALGLINCLSTPIIFPLNDRGTISPTAMTSGATSAGVWYCQNGLSISSSPVAILGYVEYNSTGLVTPGTYATAPNFVQLAGPNTPRPGQEIQRQVNFTGAVASGSTVMPNDDTIPQSAEGDQYMAQAITPTSAANVLHVSHLGNYQPAAGAYIGVALFQDSTANSLAAVYIASSSGLAYPNPLEWIMAAGTISATTFKVRAGSSSGTNTFNGSATNRKFGGVIASFLSVRELMA